MEERRPQRWVRRLKRLLFFSVGALALLFLGLQIALATPWLRDRVSAKFSQRSGLDITIGGLGWTPWGGASVKGLVVEQPRGIREFSKEPLVRVGCVRVFPDYGACLRQQWHVSRLEIDQPEFTVSIEMLVSIAASSLPAVEPPVVAMAPAPPAPAQVPLPSTPAGESRGGGQDSSAFAKPESPAAAAPEPVKAPQRRPVEVVVRNGCFELFSIRETRSLAALRGFELELPLWIDGAGGECRIGQISLLEQAIETNVKMEVSISGDVIDWRITEASEEKLQLTGKGTLRIVEGIPFQAVVGCRLDTGLKLDLPGLGSTQVASNQTMVQGGGWALAPMSWRGILQFQGEGVKLEERGLDFARCGASVLLQNGVLQVPDVRFLGDQFAVLGNGWVNRESGSGVVRLVVPSQAAELVQGRLGVFRLEALEPGNRQYFDLNFWREPAGWMADLDGKSVPLDELWAE